MTTIDDLTPFERWQLEKYGNITCTTETEETEDRDERHDKWLEVQEILAEYKMGQYE